MDWVRPDRDIVDWATIVTAIFALLLAIFHPIILRRRERKEKIPLVDIKGKFLYSVSPQKFPNLISNVAKATPFVLYHDKTMSENELKPSDFLPSMMLYRKFEIVLINKKPFPVGLNRIRTTHTNYDSVKNGDKFAFDAIFSVTDEDQVIERNPVINLGPNETKKMTVLVSHICFPGIKSVIQNQIKSTERFQQMLEAGTSPDYPIDKKTFHISTGSPIPKTISEGLQKEFASVVYTPVFEEYLSQIDFSELQFVVSDYLGQDFVSNKIDSKSKVMNQI